MQDDYDSEEFDFDEEVNEDAGGGEKGQSEEVYSDVVDTQKQVIPSQPPPPSHHALSSRTAHVPARVVAGWLGG